MRHGVRKTRFGAGIDANRAFIRKLASNFIKNGKMVTTEKRAKALKSYLEILVHKTKVESMANKNFLLSKLGSPSLVKTMFSQIGPAAKDKTSGYMVIRRLHSRISDGATMTEVRWSMPVVMEEPKVKVTQVVATDAKAKVPAKKTK